MKLDVAVHHSAGRARGRARQPCGHQLLPAARTRFPIEEPGFARLITHLFQEGADHLATDVVFGARDEPVVPFTDPSACQAPDGGASAEPHLRAEYDVVLHRETRDGESECAAQDPRPGARCKGLSGTRSPGRPAGVRVRNARAAAERSGRPRQAPRLLPG
ncbi:hypothetical protein GCM10009642_52050 [Nocardiopsis metallicus]